MSIGWKEKIPPVSWILPADRCLLRPADRQRFQQKQGGIGNCFFSNYLIFNGLCLSRPRGEKCPAANGGQHPAREDDGKKRI